MSAGERGAGGGGFLGKVYDPRQTDVSNVRHDSPRYAAAEPDTRGSVLSEDGSGRKHTSYQDSLKCALALDMGSVHFQLKQNGPEARRRSLRIGPRRGRSTQKVHK